MKHAPSLLVLALLCLGRPAVSAPAPATFVTNLRCEYAENPLGIDAPNPRLSWTLESARRGQMQSAYQVLVASSDAKLKANQGDLWDSGKVSSDRSIQLAYAGKALASRQRCCWKVRVWDRDGKPTAYSKPATWEMGLLKPDDWQAQWITFLPTGSEDAGGLSGASWIWFPEGNPTASAPAGRRFFRKTFDLPADAKIKNARFELTVDDQFVLTVNGKEAAKSSGQTDAWRQPAKVDLKALLVPGRNVLAVAATNTGDSPAGFIGRLAVEIEAGQPVIVRTDRTWKTANAEPAGWQGAGFDDAAWQAARVAARYGAAPWGDFAAAGGGTGAARYLRQQFSAPKAVRQARLYATAFGVYEFSLNGKRVGNRVFAPEWTDYNKRVMYQTYDVTGMLRQGQNVLGAVLGDGWYSGYVGLGGRNRYGTTPMIRCRLVLEYADGTSQSIVTDGSWKGSGGPILASDMLMGETYDARKEMPGWSAPGFDDAKWPPAAPQEAKAGVQLVAQDCPPVRVTQELKAKSVKEPAKGAFVFDLGQNMVGWARLRVKGDAGTTVTLRFAEMLNPDGTIYTTNYRGARCTDHYTLKGGGEEVYEPTFTFRGFRYVEVTGVPGPLGADAITGVVVGSDTPRVGTFECSSKMVDQLQSNITWGQRGNFLSVPTDCPQRDERLGWMGDAQIFIRTATHNMDVSGFFTKWAVDVDDAQSADGAYPDVAPRVAAGAGTAAWGDAGVICPWTVYLAYGDTRILEKHFDNMAKWVEYCRAHSNGLLRPAQGYGDWLSIAASTPQDVLATAYFAYSTRLVAKSAAVIGRDADAKKYEDLFQQIKAAFNKAYVGPDGRIKGNTQTCYVLALRFDLLPDNLREAAAKYLAEDIEKKGWHLSTGFVGVGYLLPTLTDAGRLDIAYRLLNQDTFPSWGYSIKYGATTIWERWDGWTKERGFQDAGMNSFNHYSLGSVGQWLYETVAGIAPDADKPGYKHLIVAPRPGGGLTYARAEQETPYGKAASSWKIEGGKLLLDVTIPANTTATVSLPAADAGQITEGGKPLAKMDGLLGPATAGAGAVVFPVGSGTYHFALPAGEVAK